MFDSSVQFLKILPCAIPFLARIALEFIGVCSRMMENITAARTLKGLAVNFQENVWILFIFFYFRFSHRPHRIPPFLSALSH